MVFLVAGQVVLPGYLPKAQTVLMEGKSYFTDGFHYQHLLSVLLSPDQSEEHGGDAKGGSILNADYPQNWVNIACRFTTRLGSYVVCDDKSLLYEEAPQAYKDIDSIIADLVSFGLIEVVATFTPLLTYKVRGR